MISYIKSAVTVHVFPTICYLLAAYFLFAFAQIVGVPPSKSLDATSGGYLALALFMFMLPEAKKLKLGQLFEYEAKVKEIKEDVKQFTCELCRCVDPYVFLKRGVWLLIYRLS